MAPLARLASEPLPRAKHGQDARIAAWGPRGADGATVFDEAVAERDPVPAGQEGHEITLRSHGVGVTREAEAA